MPRFPPLPPAPESPTGYVVYWRPEKGGRWTQIGEADTYAEAVKISCDDPRGGHHWITPRKPK